MMAIGHYGITSATSIIIINMILHGKYNWTMTACYCAPFQKDHSADKVLQMTIMLLVLRYQVSLQKYF